MTIAAFGTQNTTALIVPDLLVQIVPPQNAVINGVPSNNLGVVGTASWGPVNAPTPVSTMSQFSALFGPVVNRKYDAGTVCAVATQQGAQVFTVVRVTDGTDTAASATIGSSPVSLTLSSKYTGTFGNNIVVIVSTGSAASTWKLTVKVPTQLPEVFDNISGSGNTFWVNVAAAVNGGQSGIRGPSNIIVATAGSGSASPSSNTFNLSGGTDGVASVVGTTLVGVNSSPPTGMFALSNSGASIVVLADCDDTTTWSAQDAFGKNNGMYMILVGPQGQTVSSASTAKTSAGIDSYGSKVLMGDWIYWLDTVNNVTRLVSPQGFSAGLLANLSPQNSSLNKRLFGVVATQTSNAGTLYAAGDLQVLALAGIDLITNPVPGGRYFGVRFGRNSSSNPVIHTDSYTRMTNYIASTLNAGMGQYIGQNQSLTVQANAAATLTAFFDGLFQQGLIGNSTGTLPYQITLDVTNNPANRVALGYMQADVKVQYLSVVEEFIVNVEGGQSVIINRVSTTPNV